MPSEGRAAARSRAAAEGLALHAALRAQLDAIAHEFDVPRPVFG